MLWHYVDVNGQQRGPVASRLIMHKLHEGDIDGMTLVYSADLGEWKKLTEVNVLKDAIMKMQAEEQAAEEATRAAEAAQKELGQSELVYFIDEETQPALPDFLKGKKNISGEKSSGSGAGAGATASADDGGAVRQQKALRKTFVADSGVKYLWDDLENDWVECEDDDESDDEEEEVEEEEEYDDSKGTFSTTAKGKAGKKALTAKTGGAIAIAKQKTNQAPKRKKTDDANDEGGKAGADVDEDDADVDDDRDDDDWDAAEGKASGDQATQQQQQQKRKRNKKKKKKAKGPNNWIYISGLPKDATLEEVKAHFGKVRRTQYLFAFILGGASYLYYCGSFLSRKGRHFYLCAINCLIVFL
jgi:hypothetical protein